MWHLKMIPMLLLPLSGGTHLKLISTTLRAKEMSGDHSFKLETQQILQILQGSGIVQQFLMSFSRKRKVTNTLSSEQDLGSTIPREINSIMIRSLSLDGLRLWMRISQLIAPAFRNSALLRNHLKNRGLNSGKGLKNPLKIRWTSFYMPRIPQISFMPLQGQSIDQVSWSPS